MKNKSLFRKTALERLSSPEQLDHLMRVTSPRSWFILLAIGCILVTGVIWGVFGSIPVTVDGAGILIRGGGVFNVVHSSAGQITDIRVAAGDTVRRGDVVARIDQAELSRQINEMQEELDELKSAPVRGDLAGALAEAEHRIQMLRDEMILKSTVISHIDGRVLEVMVSKGDVIQPGMPLMSMEHTGEAAKMEAVVYVRPEEGKLILPGMRAHISPSTVNKEEYGYMLGSVVSVSEYPATARGMLLTLGSEELVARLAGNGAPLEVRIDLIPDGDTVSGFRWSSPQGPPLGIDSGTLIGGEVVISEQRPIEMVLPVAAGSLVD